MGAKVVAMAAGVGLFFTQSCAPGPNGGSGSGWEFGKVAGAAAGAAGAAGAIFGKKEDRGKWIAVAALGAALYLASDYQLKQARAEGLRRSSRYSGRPQDRYETIVVKPQPGTTSRASKQAIVWDNKEKKVVNNNKVINVTNAKRGEYVKAGGKDVKVVI